MTHKQAMQCGDMELVEISSRDTHYGTIALVLVPLISSYEQFTVTSENTDSSTEFGYKHHVLGEKRNHTNLGLKETNSTRLKKIKNKVAEIKLPK